MNMEQIYQKIAKDNGVTVETVKKDMQIAINHAYKNSTNSITKLYQCQVPRKKAIPTYEEFIRFISHKIKR